MEQGRRRHYDVHASSRADRARVFALLLDGRTWPLWSRIDSYEEEQAADGPTRVFRTGRNVSRERLVEVEPQRRLVYEMLSDGGGLLRGYRGTIELTPTADGGTNIRWRATWSTSAPVVGWLMERYLRRFQQHMVDGLARYAENDQADARSS